MDTLILLGEPKVTHQSPTMPGDQIKELMSNHAYDVELTSKSSSVDQVQGDIGKIEPRVYAVDRQMKCCSQYSEEGIKRMEINVENAFHKALEVQKNNEELHASNVDLQNQLSLTQRQLQRNDEQLLVISRELQANNEHLLNQLSIILDKLSYTQQQLSDMQQSSYKQLMFNYRISCPSLNNSCWVYSL